MALVFHFVEAGQVVVERATKVHAQQVLFVGFKVGVQFHYRVLKQLVLVQLKDLRRRSWRSERCQAKRLWIYLELVCVQGDVICGLRALDPDADLQWLMASSG